jgi:hypothetical protein
MTKLKYATPSQLQRDVKSAIQRASGRVAVKVAVDEVRAIAAIGVGDRRLPRSAASFGAHEPVGGHQTLDAAAADRDVVAAPLFSDTPGPLALVVGLEHPADLAEQPLVLDGTPRQRARGALVVSRRGRPRCCGTSV